MSDLRVAIAGAGGRMGAANIRAVAATPGLVLHAAFDRPDSPAIGRDAGELRGARNARRHHRRRCRSGARGRRRASSISPRRRSACMLAELAAERGLVHIIGTTGCSKEDDWAIQKAGPAGARIVKSGNFSLGVNMLLGPGAQGGGGAAGLRHRNPRNAPQQEGRCALGHRADARPGRRRRPRRRSRRSMRSRSRDGHTGARAAGSIGFADAARRRRHRRPHA